MPLRLIMMISWGFNSHLRMVECTSSVDGMTDWQSLHLIPIHLYSNHLLVVTTPMVLCTGRLMSV